MLQIGIDDRRHLVYEGPDTYGRIVWPSPIITSAKLVSTMEGPLESAKSVEIKHCGWRFREDYYDPIARIRRGRFYSTEGAGQQPQQWQVAPLTVEPFQSEKRLGTVNKNLVTFKSVRISGRIHKEKHEQLLVLLGVDDGFTVWTIVDVETISTGEDLVTLKARSRLGVLPEVQTEKIPEGYLREVNESLDAFVDEVHRSAPVSVIDRARDAVSQVLLAYFEAKGIAAKDLGALTMRIDALDKEGKSVAANAARIIARLHARAKPVEQAKRILRPIREQDAELATQCVGAILCELGWADWA